MHLDPSSLDLLIKRLTLLREKLTEGGCEHTHMMSESWGTRDLTETMLESESSDQATQVHHLKIQCWTNEYREKYCL